jgi:hypothetical protein
MTAVENASARVQIRARTLRTDRWWVQPALTGAVLTVFLIYTVIRVFMRKWYWVDSYGYLTPLYSPCLSTSCAPGASHFGQPFGDFPIVIPITILTLVIVMGFRVTCYYYRKVQYRSFLLSPPGCAVKEPGKTYKGESRFPFILQNSHRYFFYIASLLALVNTYDAVHSFFPKYGGFGFGIGSLLMVAMVASLWLYTLSCHACRHVMGGKLKHFSKHPVRYRMWGMVSKLNHKHMQFAWISLLLVMATDIYIMSVSAGWISDLRIIN